jgi:hypothetical protein
MTGFVRTLLAAGVLAASLASAQPAAADCASACRNQHNQCRIATKGSPSCDAQLTQCLRGCRGR